MAAEVEARPASRRRGDLRSWDDFSRLPFTRKAELVADQAAHPPFGTNLTYPLDRYVRVHQTSGTTRRAAPLARHAGVVGLVGALLGLRAARGRARRPATASSSRSRSACSSGSGPGFEGARAIGALAIPGGGQDSAQRLAAIEALGATAICCTPSYALHLAEVARERGVDLRKLGLCRTTVHAGEPGAGHSRGARADRGGSGARAPSTTPGMTEMGAYGFECDAQAGTARQRVGVHRRGHRSRDAAQPAREGELVLTQPRARWARRCSRYRTGDRVRVADGPCGCGRTFLRLDGRHPGPRRRHADRPGRQRLFPSALEGIVRRFPAVDEFQIEVYRARAMDEVRLLVEVTGDGRGVRRAVGAGDRARRPRHPRRGGAGAGGQPAALRAEGPPPRPPHRFECTLGLMPISRARIAGDVLTAAARAASD